MAVKRVYTIEIQLDAARAALSDANKKLQQLGESLTGLDRDTDAAKSIVVEMEKAAKQVESLTKEVGGLSSALDDLQPGTIGALRDEAKRLEAALDGALEGSADASRLIGELGKVKAQLKDIDEAVDVSFDKDRAGALADAATGVAGAFSLATVAAQNFGLTKDDADKYNQKLLEMLSVVQSLEQIQKLTTSEVSTALKSLFGDAKRVIGGYLGIGQASTAAGGAARASATVARLALASIGIGVLLLLLGLVVTNWDKITASVKKNKEAVISALGFIFPPLGLLLQLLDKVEKKFGSVSALASGVAAAFKQVFTNFGDIVSGAEGQGKTVAEAFHGGVTKRNAELADERLKAQLKEQLGLNEQYVKILKAKGRDTFELEKKIFADKIHVAKQQTKEEKQLYAELVADFSVFRTERRLKLAADEQAQELAQLNARLGQLQAAGKQTFDLQVQIKQRELSFLLSAPQRNAAAITAKEGEIAAIRVAAQQALAVKEYEEFKKRVTETEALQLVAVGESERRKADARLKLQEVLGQKIQAGTDKYLDRIEAEAKERADNLKRQPVTIGERLLLNLFDVRPENLEEVKNAIGQAIASINQSVNEAAVGLLGQATAEADARLQDAQNRLDLLDQALQSRQQAADDTEAKLQTATGARRDFLLLKLRKEREEEEKTRAARAKAAKEEQQALKERHKLEVAGQKITAASTFAASAYNSVLAIQAALEAVKSGAKLPFPGNIIAVVAAVAAVGATIVQARNLGKTLKLEQGGLLKGPRHSQGGIPVGQTGIEVEGGEYVVNRWATAHFLPELERMNQMGRVRVLAAPSSRRYEAGGQLPGAGGGGQPAGTVLVKEADLAETNALLRQIAAYTGIEAAKPIPQLTIGQPEALAIEQQRQSGLSIQSGNSL